jgi:hypothetical protein
MMLLCAQWHRQALFVRLHIPGTYGPETRLAACDQPEKSNWNSDVTNDVRRIELLCIAELLAHRSSLT